MLAFAGVVLDADAAGGYVGLRGDVGDVGEGYAFGEGGAGFEFGHFDGWWCLG